MVVSLPKSDELCLLHTIEAMQHFAGATDNIANFYCDNADELITSARACKWRIATATTGTHKPTLSPNGPFGLAKRVVVAG